MALVKVQLTSPITPNQLVFGVSSVAVGFPGVGIFSNPQQPLMVDQELMFLVQVLSASPAVIQVRSRGSDGSQAIGHDITAPVITSPSPADFPLPALGEWVVTPIESNKALFYGQSGPIGQATPGSDAAAILNGPSAMAMTLAAPSLAQNGILLRLTTGSAFAHSVSAPGLLLTGAVGGPFSTITFPAFIGSWVDLIAENGQWSVNGTNGAVVFS